MGNWLSNLWFGYWWPSIKGNGPEDLASLIAVGLISAVLIPAVRRFFHRGWDSLHSKLDGLGDHHRETQRMLQHVIDRHPDIPPLPPKEDS